MWEKEILMVVSFIGWYYWICRWWCNILIIPIVMIWNWCFILCTGNDTSILQVQQSRAMIAHVYTRRRAPTIPHYCTAWSHLYLSVTIWTRERVFIKSQFVVWRSSIFFLSFCFISLNLEDSSSSFYSEGIGHGGGWSPVFPNDTRTLSKNTYSKRSVA